MKPDFEARVRAFHDAMEAEFGVQWSARKMDSENQDRVRAVVKAMDKQDNQSSYDRWRADTCAGTD